jgi:tRNA uridine 5-carbamoylmethylation protein Kti12
MCLTVKEICEKKITNVYPLVEPILNVVQSQYGNVDNYIALKARQNVTGVLRFARVAAQVSAGTLLDSNVLDVVEAETSIVNATVKAVTAWAKSHHDEPKQLDEVERAINERLGEINFEKDPRAQDIAALYEDLKKPLRMKAPT